MSAAADRLPWPGPHPFAAERGWLDALLEREILRLRARYELSLDELRGLYVSDAQVDDLLARHLAPDPGPAPDGPSARLTREAARYRAGFDPGSPLALLGERLALGPEDLEALFIAWAPELDLRYETLYGYLNNDLARRTATLDLLRRLLGDTADRGHRVLTRAQSLIAAGLLRAPGEEPQSALGQPLTVGRAVTRFLLGIPPEPWGLGPTGAAAGTLPRLERVAPGAVPAARIGSGDGEGELILCRGEDPGALARWAGGLLAGRGLHALHLTPEALIAQGEAPLYARLAGAALVLHEPPAVDRDPPALERLAGLLHGLLGEGRTLLWLVPRGWQPQGALAQVPLACLDLPAPGLAERTAGWARALHAGGLGTGPGAGKDGGNGGGDPWGELAASLAGRFSLGEGGIRQAVRSARALGALEPELPGGVAVERAARQIAALSLAQVAQHATKPHTWDHLVLPATTLALLHEVAAAVAARGLVFRDWALQRRTGRSSGLMLLFAGASGTGKTMAASVIANAVGLELYRIDLAGVVSKYIGETEKNLDRIFTVAKDADAILLFDEADALLGKRAEVKDAHDRYANIEVAYLLQKMEDHDGVVILASNLPKNLDQAFSRRLHYVVEFPRPNPALRVALWQGMLPAELPRAADIDFGFLAEQFDLTGGDIQAIVLEAAFLAASQGGPLGMGQLMHALARRQTKHGDPGVAARFRVHRDSLSRHA